MNKPNCATEDSFNKFLSGELERSDHERLNTHLEECVNCQSRMDTLTDSQLGISLSGEPAQDPAISQFVSRLSVFSPSFLEDSDSGTSSGMRFPLPPSTDAPLGQLGHYKIQELIGSGASGLLYRATDPRINREVAIKVLRSELASHQESRERLNREARAVAGLKHDGVVQMFEFGNNPDFPPYMVMEYINGGSIAERLEKSSVIAAGESVDMAIPIARALGAAHELGLVHRDVKPSNILLDGNTQPKVTDFGLALLDDENSNLTREGSIAGTPAYISPEQILDPHNVDGRTDTYSLGVVLYQMLTGELPFQGVARMTLLAVLHKDPPAPRMYNDEIPSDLETIVLKAMSKDRDKRYATASEFADDLQRWKDGRPILARPVSRFERFWRWCKRNPGTARLSATVAMLLLTVTVGSVIASVRLAAERRKAEEATAEAHSQRDRAFETLESLVLEVNQKFQRDEVSFGPRQNQTAARKAMLGISVRGLRQITTTADDAGRLNISTAAAHIRLAKVLAERREDDEAIVHFEKGDRILTQLGGEDSDQLPVAKLVVESAFSRAIHFGQKKDDDRCKELLIDADRIAKKAYKRWPDNFEAHYLLARTQVAVASYLSLISAERTGEMLPEARKTVMELEKKYPEHDGVYWQGTMVLRISAGFARNEGDNLQAFEYYKRLADRCRTALAKGAESTRYSEWLAISFYEMGACYMKRGDNVNALEHLEKFMEVQNESNSLYYPLSKIQVIQRGIEGLRYQLKNEETKAY